MFRKLSCWFCKYGNRITYNNRVILRKIKNRNNDLESSDVNTWQSVKTRRGLMSKAGSYFSIDQDEFSISKDGKKTLRKLHLDRHKVEQQKVLSNLVWNSTLTKKIFSF